ncbi:MAG: DUF4115 domain-containing protein [Alphaproteobacteria bacterium]|nr:DUF4115 domain-containing protein [Alphaproteobacteria bacterium]
MARSRQKRSKTVDLVEPSSGDDAVGGRRFDSVGITLRAERERRGWDLGDVAHQLKIRRVHLEAIEEDRFDLVPAGTYAVNFVRTYSEALGLDAVEMVRRYREALTGSERRLELHFPQPLPESKLPGGIILLVSIAIAALAYGAWLVLNQGVRDTLARVDPVPQQLQQAAVAPPPPAPSPSPTPSLDARAATETASAPAVAESTPPAAPPSAAPVTSPPPALAAAPSPPPTPVQPVPAAPPVSAPPVSPAGAGATLPGGPPVAPQLAPVAPAPPPPQPQVTETPQGTRIFGEGGPPARIVIVAQADSWVQVREASGATIFMRILKAGDVYNVPNRPGLLLTTGSAGSIEVKVDGKVAPSLGNKGFVRRDVPLDADRLLAGSTGEAVRPPQAAPARPGG